MIKCVIWDLDNTLLDGVYLESGPQRPPPEPAMLGVLRELTSRGIVHALATRNPPEAAEYAGQVTGQDFAAAECGWGRKSDAVAAIIAELGIAADAVAFVDDELMERAEVSAALPDVLVLAAEDMPEAAGWPQFSPAVLTAEGRRRGELYAQRRRRQEEARAFGGSSDAFLRYCQTRLVIGSAAAADVPRLHELSERTHQFNSAGPPVSPPELVGLIGAGDREVIAARLSDRFGDDGIVGGCVIDTSGRDASSRDTGQVIDADGWPAWRVQLLIMSCRAMGRGVIDALLAWLCQAAARAGARQVDVPCLVTARNVPLRIALAAAGFRADPPAAGGAPASHSQAGRSGAGHDPAGLRPASRRPGSHGRPVPGPDRAVVFSRRLDGPLPELPDWATAPDYP
jgi:methoxymalonate biosynthesis protein